MRRVAGWLFAGAVGYVAGNLPSADLAARASGGVRPGREGTQNPGALNTSHLLGPKWGLAVSVLDVGKGVVAARLGGRLAGAAGANLASTAAVVGHCYPVGRRGGKGVATSVGQVIGTFPAYLPIDVGVAAATAALPFFHRRTRAATLAASATWVGCATLSWRRHLRTPGGIEPTAALPLAALTTSLVIAARFAADADLVDADPTGHTPP